jgi:hypothetical protein
MTDKPTITLTYSAATRLNQISNTPQLVTGVDDLYRIGAFNEDHLAEIPPGPPAPLETAPRETIDAWRSAIKAWAGTKLPEITTSQRRIDSIKAMLKSAAEKGLLAGSATDRQLLRVFGLAPDDA